MEIAPYLWYDGALRPRAEVSVDPLAHALHYGTGVFEGIRAYATPRGPAIFRLREHMERFVHSADVYGLALGLDAAALCAATVATMERNRMGAAYIRPLAFFGEKTIGLAPRFVCPTHLLIALRALGNYFREDQAEGIRTTISPWRKFSSRALPATAKGCGHYANSVLAMQDAVGRGFDEAILLNDRSEVAEGTGENVFYVKDGTLRTNDRSADILLGITRDSVLALARDLGIPVEIAPIELEELEEADEVFFTGTAVEVTPIVGIDERRYPSEHPITTALRRAYQRAVLGDDPRHGDWLTYVTAAAPA
ncbi:MAG: branched-chain amino acid transaminase [Vulcanimicrobiaceae bacterium]